MIRVTGRRLPGTGPHRFAFVHGASPRPKESTVPRNKVLAARNAQMNCGIIHRESTTVGTVIA
jgi:hypothetical protein